MTSKIIFELAAGTEVDCDGVETEPVVDGFETTTGTDFDSDEESIGIDSVAFELLAIDKLGNWKIENELIRSFVFFFE